MAKNEPKPDTSLDITLSEPAAPAMDTQPETESPTQLDADATAQAEAQYSGSDTQPGTDTSSLYEDSEWRGRERRQSAMFIAAKAMSGTQGVTAKGLLYLANEVEQYIESGYDAAKYNG